MKKQKNTPKGLHPTVSPDNPNPEEEPIMLRDGSGPLVYNDNIIVPRYWYTEDALDAVDDGTSTSEEIYEDSLRVGLSRNLDVEARIDMSQIPSGLLGK